MHCVPKQRKTAVVNMLFAVLVSVGAALFAWSVILGRQGEETMGALVGLSAMLLLLGGLFVLARYRLLKFAYVIRPRDDRDETGLAATYASVRDVPYFMLDLAVYKTVGAGKPRLQCVLSVEDFRETFDTGKDRGVMREIKKKYAEENGGKFICYDYTLTPKTEDRLTLIFLDGDKYVGVTLEANEQMRVFFEAIG